MSATLIALALVTAPAASAISIGARDVHVEADVGGDGPLLIVCVGDYEEGNDWWTCEGVGAIVPGLVGTLA